MSSSDTPARGVGGPRPAAARSGAARNEQPTQRLPKVDPRGPSPAAAPRPAPAPAPAPRPVAANPPPAGSNPAGASAAANVGPARPRVARLVVARVDPWSVMKLGFLLAIASAIVLIVAVAAIWHVLNGMGVFTALQGPIGEVSNIDLMDYVGLRQVLSATTILAVANVILITAMSTLAAFLYNICASLVGGLNVTLAEDR